MQAVQGEPVTRLPSGVAGGVPAAEMARHLRRVSGDDALCFARAMHEESAWANEAWGAYWAAVVQAV